MKEKNTDKQLSNALYVLLCLVRLPLTFIIAIPCYFLVLPFWLLGIKNPWQKMTRLFDELAFNR
tara:strand:- start:119 stop:310 length:192 start_codon:yes stop_codon:yes gene_type:complete